MALNSKLWTRILTTGDSPFVLTAEDGISIGSILCTTGSVATITGTRTVKGLPSEAITLPENVPFAFDTAIGALAEFTITISSGTVEIAGY